MDVKARLGVQRSTAPGLGWRRGKRRLPGGNGINERLEGVCQGLRWGDVDTAPQLIVLSR